jgi:hypothetical protein
LSNNEVDTLKYAQYSDYDVFPEMIGVHGYIGVKSNSKTPLKKSVSNFWAVSCELGFKVSKSANMT